MGNRKQNNNSNSNGGGGGGESSGRFMKPHSTPATLVWLEENYEIAQGVCIPRNTLYVHYVDFCSKHGMTPVNAASFGKVPIRRQLLLLFLNSIVIFFQLLTIINLFIFLRMIFFIKSLLIYHYLVFFNRIIIIYYLLFIFLSFLAIDFFLRQWPPTVFDRW